MFKDSRLKLVLLLFASSALWACQRDPGLHRRALAAAEAGTEAGPGCGPITYQGCCSGQSLLFCAALGALQVKACAPHQCGWNATFGIYACGNTAGQDPSGKLPRSCPVSDAGLPDAAPLDAALDAALDAPSVADAQPDAGCGALGYVGCCAGQTLLFCSGGQVLSQACGGSCGWNGVKGLYDCGTSGGGDPKGIFPKSCSASLGDAGIPDLGADQAAPDQGAATDLATDLASLDQAATSDGFTTSEGAPPLEASVTRDGDPRETSGLDASGLDVVMQSDTGQLVPGGGGGCSCRVARSESSNEPSALLLALVVLALIVRGSKRVTRPWRRSLAMVVIIGACVACTRAEQPTRRNQRASMASDGAADLPQAEQGSADLKSPPADLAGCGSVGAQGCCDGETLWWCASGVLSNVSCGDKLKCGWNTTGFYDCNTSGAADPSGTHPRACKLGDAGPPPSDLGGDGATKPCLGLPLEGCCAGATLRYCDDGVLKVLSCAFNPSCGWFTQGGYYDCGTKGGADPSGVHPRSCPGVGPADTGLDLAGDPGGTTPDLGGDTGGPANGCGSCEVGRAGVGGALWLALAALLLIVRRRASA